MNLFLKKSSKNADKKLNKNFLNGNDMFPKKYFIILLDFITIIKELSKPSVGTCLTLIASIILLVLRSKLVPKKKSTFNSLRKKTTIFSFRKVCSISSSNVILAFSNKLSSFKISKKTLLPKIDIVKLLIKIMNIKVKKNNFLIFGNYKLKCCVGKSGIKTAKKEGDLATPKGIFNLGYLYYREDRNKNIKCKIKKKIIKKNMAWCDDVKSQKYNYPIYLPSKFKSEKIYRKDRIYDLFINVKYNSNPSIKGKGSAIFLHLTNKSFKPTEGCVAIMKKDFLKILPYITNKTKISIG